MSYLVCASIYSHSILLYGLNTMKFPLILLCSMEERKSVGLERHTGEQMIILG